LSPAQAESSTIRWRKKLYDALTVRRIFDEFSKAIESVPTDRSSFSAYGRSSATSSPR
jgi:hypothetical protein